MTKQQIEYQKLQELKRSNRATERLTEGRDLRSYQLGLDELAEKRRSNMAVQMEAQRHNVVGENEQQRHNRATEEAALQSLGIQRYEADTRRMGVGVQSKQIDLGYAQLAESQRHSMAIESETQRANLVDESERQRSNLAREQETQRANIARELETARLNSSTIDLNSARTTSESHRNVRDWIDTGFSIIPNIADNVSAVIDLVPVAGSLIKRGKGFVTPNK